MEGGPCDDWESIEGDYDSDESIRTSLEGCKFDSEVAIVVGALLACLEGCQLFIRVTTAIVCKEKIPNVAVLKVGQAEVSTTIWRCDSCTEVPNTLSG